MWPFSWWCFHSWGKWLSYTRNHYYMPGDRHPQYTEFRQRRRCGRCGKEADVKRWGKGVYRGYETFDRVEDNLPSIVAQLAVACGDVL